MDTKQLNEKESLELIARMIRNTQNNLESHGGMYILIWGYTTIGISLLVYFLLTCTHNPAYNFFWFGIPLIGGAIISITFRSRPLQKITTYIDKVTNYIWLVVGLTAGFTSIAAFFTRLPILFIIALLISIGITITGLVIKFRLLTVFGFISIALSYSLLVITGLDSILIFCVLFILNSIIPGHVLNHSEKKNRQKPEDHV